MKPRRIHLLLISLLLLLAALLSSCTGEQPSPTLVPAVTFTSGQDFGCWHNPAPAHSLAAFSPEQGHLLIEAYRTLYNFDLATQNPEILMHVPDGFLGDVSPDGRYIWYGFIHKENVLTFMYDRVERESIQVPLYPGRLGPNELVIPDTAWSADSTCLINSMISQLNRVVAYRMSDGAMQQKTLSLPNKLLSINLSPDGRWWAGDCVDQVCVADFEGSQIDHEGLHPPVREYPMIGLMRWSPNVRWLAFAYDDPAGYGTEGHLNSVRVVEFGAQGVVGFTTLVGVLIQDLQWAPYGNELLINGQLQRQDGRCPIYDATVSESRYLSQVTCGVPLAWSPDGQYIVGIEEGEKENEKIVKIVDKDKDEIVNTFRVQIPGSVEQVFWVP